MNVTCYLIIQGKPAKYGADRDKRRERGNLRLSIGKPDLNADEVAVKLDMEVPDSLFYKPQLEAKISIPPGSPRDSIITAAVQDNIAAIIKDQTGLTVTITALEAVDG